MSQHHAIFLVRLNRFVAQVELPDGSRPLVHVASSGRMTELLRPGVNAVVEITGSAPDRKTEGRLLMVQSGQTWVSVDTSLPGKLFHRAVAAGQVEPFLGYTEIRPEYTYGDSRIDFLLTSPGLPPCLVEVKSVTSAIPDSTDGALVARFPDAPTTRGTKHLHELMAAAQAGYRTAVCFLVQRDDVAAFGPYEEIDPTFAESLRRAAAAGVAIHAWQLHVNPSQIMLGAALPIRL